jgi:hypothetical protein
LKNGRKKNAKCESLIFLNETGTSRMSREKMPGKTERVRKGFLIILMINTFIVDRKTVTIYLLVELLPIVSIAENGCVKII